MSILLILVCSVSILLFMNVKFGIYQSSSRLANFCRFDDKDKWNLITRWGSICI